MHRLLARLETLLHRKGKEADLEAEIAFHLSEEEDERVDSGASRERAREEARGDFGNVALVRDHARESWGLTWAENVARNLVKTAFKSVLRTPRSSFAVVLCIGVAMAGTSATATLVSATLWRSLPFPEADRLVRVWLEATARARIQFLSDDGSRRVEGEAVTSGYFELLGVEPLMGHLFTEEEHLGLGERAILLGYTSWASAFGHDPGIVGTELRTNLGAHTIVGVLPERFSGTVESDSNEIEFWVPITRYIEGAAQERRDARNVWTLGRLAPGGTLSTARAEADNAVTELRGLFPDSYAARDVNIEPLGENWRSSIRRGSLLLLAAAVLVLVVASANVALLLLARSIDNRRHWALRMALGAAPTSCGSSHSKRPYSPGRGASSACSSVPRSCGPSSYLR